MYLLKHSQTHNVVEKTRAALILFSDESGRLEFALQSEYNVQYKSVNYIVFLQYLNVL